MDSKPFDYKKLDAWHIESTEGRGYSLTYTIRCPGLVALTMEQLSRYVNGIIAVRAKEILTSLLRSTDRASSITSGPSSPDTEQNKNS